MSKLSFRARALDAGKPMPIYMAEELPDLPDYSAINRAVPQMPSGMEKEEECEHHLQRAICAGLIIPTPEVSDMPDREFHDKVYPANYKQPRQLIHMQPFTMEQDIPDYDMDSEDERWLQAQATKLELNPLKFEEMMDRLEKSSGQTVVTLNEAKALLKEDDDLIIAVFDYWLNKRLKTQHPLILTVKTEQRAGTAANNPYLAFRRRTEKMQTRKNRKNDETSYEKMLKLKRDLQRAVTLLELVKKREKMKREHVHLTVEIFEKRYQAKDFSGAIYAEAAAVKAATRPAFTPIFHNHYTNQAWAAKAIHKDEVVQRKEKRQYKKRKHKAVGHSRSSSGLGSGLDALGGISSDEETLPPQMSPEPEEVEDEGQFAFRRNKLCSYHMPLPETGNWAWCSKEENGLADKRFRFTLTSLSSPRRCVGFARRRLGRGGRVILDRAATDDDDFWRTLDFSIVERAKSDEKLLGAADVKSDFSNVIATEDDLRTNDKISEISESVKTEIKKEIDRDDDGDKDEMVEILRSVQRDWLHFRPKTPPSEVPESSMQPASESYFVPSANGASFSVELQPLEAPSALLDASTFLSDPFTFDSNLDCLVEVPVTDTRQSRPQNSALRLDDRTFGRSKFRIFDADAAANESASDDSQPAAHCASRNDIRNIVKSTSTSPNKFNNSVNAVSDGAKGSVGNTNGLLSQFALDGRTKNNKVSYAYSGGVGYSNASPSTLSLHTSAHTLTLNSHSANIVEFPITDEAEPVASNKHPEGVGAVVAAANNKTKTIVRKNNIVMEVT